MKQKTLFVLWGGMFILCAMLGFIPEPEGAARWLLTALSVLSFLPPFLIWRKARQEKDRNCLGLLRNLSGASLGLTAALLMVNFLSFAWPEQVGNVLYVLLVILSSPMICAGYWVLSLFLWACLMIASHKALKR